MPAHELGTPFRKIRLRTDHVRFAPLIPGCAACAELIRPVYGHDERQR